LRTLHFLFLSMDGKSCHCASSDLLVEALPQANSQDND